MSSSSRRSASRSVEHALVAQSVADAPVAPVSPLSSEASLRVPVVPMRGLVAFPGVVFPLFLGRARSIAALDALPEDGEILLVAQRDETHEEPRGEDLYRVGTLARVLQSAPMPDGHRRLVVEGCARARVHEWDEGEHLSALVSRLESSDESGTGARGAAPLVKKLKTDFVRLVNDSKTLPPEAITHAQAHFSLGPLSDLIAAHLDVSSVERQQLLETLSPMARAKRVAELLARELRGAELDHELDLRVRETLAEGQREFLLRERLKAIQDQLGDGDNQTREAKRLRAKIADAGLSGEALSVAEAEVERFERLTLSSPEAPLCRAYIEWLCALPWKSRAPEHLDLRRARKILDDAHFGLEPVKERLIEFLAVRKLNPTGRAPILCFVGPPGVGKTSLGRSVADALGRPFARISLGGVHDEAEVRGHRRTYVGALPGKLLANLRRVEAKNPVFVLDEIDKLGDGRGDPAAALLEALDPEQNCAFTDHYLEVPFDLSEVLWIATANLLDTVPHALRDRMEVVRLPGYTETEKRHIARRHLLPKLRQEHGLDARTPHLSDATLARVVRDYTREAGVRNLERELAALCRKVARQQAEDGPTRVSIAPSDLDTWLGARRFSSGAMLSRPEIGVAQGLAYTECGGEVMPIEVTLVPGSGQIKLTGNLGAIMRESCEAALTFARARDDDGASRQLSTHDTHIHVPSGAIPKDGPSAGVAIAVAVVSALTNRPVRCDVAMSGEVTLRGRVLPVGGIKEKVLAAHRAGAKLLLLPRENESDLRDVPPEVRETLQFHFADDLRDVLSVALVTCD